MNRKACLLAAISLFSTSALADGRELAKDKIQNLQAITNSEIDTASDLVPVYDASARTVKQMPVGQLPVGTATTATTATFGNPLQMATVGVLTLASVNAGTNILLSTSGKSIYPSDWMLMASGSAATATGVYLRCTGGNVISSVPIAMLTDGVPVGPFKSAGPAGTGTAVLGSALVRGCPSGESIYISVSGSALATTTHLYYMLPYIVQ